MKSHEKHNISLRIKKMVITSIFIALSIITSFSTNFISLPFLASFLTLDISLIFIIALLVITSYYWALFAGITLGCFSFIWSSGIWIGAVFNIIVNVFTITIIWIFDKYVFKNIKNYWLKWGYNLISTLIIITFSFTLLNGILFQPLWWWFFNTPLKSISFIEAEFLYNNNFISHAFLLWMPNYWSGIFALYTSFNLFKFSIVFLIAFPAINVLIKSGMIEKYFKH